MSLPNVVINETNGNLGLVNPTDDAVSGMIFSGTATASLLLGVAKQLFSFKQFTDLGVTEVNNPLAYKDVKAFYERAGDGTELWVMLISDAVTIADITDETKAYLKKLLDAASGRIRIIAINRTLPVAYVPTIAEGLDQDVITGITNADLMAVHYSEAYKPFRCLIPGLGFTKATVAALKDLKQLTKSHVAVVLGADTATSVAIGRTLGSLAAVPVMRKISRVKNGDAGIQAAFFPDGTPIGDLEANWNDIHDKGYIFFRKIYGKAGFFFTDDPTATEATDDYSCLARCRVIDKARIIAYTTFIEELNDEIPVDGVTGKLSAGLIASWRANIEEALNNNMKAKGEISKAECYINPAQNVLSTDKIEATVKITPVGYSSVIEIDLGLSNPYKTS
jgi:hypothetical protein